MEENKQNLIDLRKRFVSDLNLPIQVLHSPYFEDRLHQLEGLFQAESKYNNLMSIINERFRSNPSLFLDEYYNVRENIIQAILKNEAYIKFNESKEIMQKYAIPKSKQFPKKNPYAEDMIGKIMLSIDLTKANFQALNFVDKNICLNSETYSDFIHKFTDLDYIVDSKYTRQVVFGKLNPSRQITVEKYIMSLVNEVIEASFKNDVDLKLICLNADELIYEVFNESLISDEKKENIIYAVKKSLNIDVKVEFFKVNTIKFKHDNGATLTIFDKHKLLSDSHSLMCAPQTYLPQILALLNDEEINDSQMTFYYEHNLAKFLSPITLDKENSSFFSKKG